MIPSCNSFQKLLASLKFWAQKSGHVALSAMLQTKVGTWITLFTYVALDRISQLSPLRLLLAFMNIKKLISAYLIAVVLTCYECLYKP